jgi:purine nucleosidase
VGTRRPVFLDVDTGIDDALALLYAAASPELELVGTGCVAGNVGVEDVVANSIFVLRLAGRADVPVLVGAASPLRKPLETTVETHGPQGIGHAVRSDPTGTPADGSAAEHLVEEARRRPGELELVTLGPLTNLALALDAEPRLPALLRRWTFMGGAFRVPGNTTPTSEWNIHVDPDAAQRCLEAWSAAIASDPGIPRPLAMGLDVTEQARVLPEHVARLARRAGAAAEDAAALLDPASPMQPAGSVASNPILRYIVDSLRFYFEFHARYDGFYGAFVHDPFALAATLDPSLVTTRPVPVAVEAGPGLAHGMTVADWRGIGGRPANVDVAVEGDAAAFVDRFIERVGALASRTA